MPQTISEELIDRICKRNFLSLWSYANPDRADKSEFCDAFIVFGSLVIIISVKEIRFQKERNDEVAYKRWTREAVKESARQINRAINYLERGGKIFESGSGAEISVPDPEGREIIGIVVAFGSDGEIPVEIITEYKSRKFLVMTEHGIYLTLRELNTISDITRYWRDLLDFDGTLIVNGHDGDLAGYYLINQRKFPQEGKVVIVDGGFWVDYASRPERHRKLEEEKISFAWDRFIELLINDIVRIQGIGGDEVAAFEQAIRTMATENRVNRRALASALIGFYDDFVSEKTRARITTPGSGVAYVFLGVIDSPNEEYLRVELLDRMHVARRVTDNVSEVVGICFERNSEKKMERYIVTSLKTATWSEQDQDRYEAIQRDFHYWESPIRQNIHVTEYPLED